MGSFVQLFVAPVVRFRSTRHFLRLAKLTCACLRTLETSASSAPIRAGPSLRAKGCAEEGEMERSGNFIFAQDGCDRSSCCSNNMSNWSFQMFFMGPLAQDVHVFFVLFFFFQGVGQY